MNFLVIGFVFWLCLFQNIQAQLTVNVKNKGGDVIRENIHANTTQDTINLEFQKSDGTLITQFIDFRNEIQIFKALVLGEEELGQSQYQVMCYITRLIKNEFISADAMSKLRQKNPSAIRHPEDDKGQEYIQMDLIVTMEQAYVISPHIVRICHDAPGATYTRDTDLKAISSTLSKDYTIMLGATKRSTTINHVQRCREIHEPFRPCICQYEICVGWYPCGLKYCRGKDSSGKVVSYRCGIKTCRKCRLFEFYSRQKQQCIWDEVQNFAELNVKPDQFKQEEFMDHVEPEKVANADVL